MSRQIGNAAEDMAARLLASQGCQVLARNYAVRGGEIDIIIRDGDTIAFVEVKHRQSARYGQPREYVTAAKRRRICRAALSWLQENGCADQPIRFDVLESLGGRVEHIRAAFDFEE